MNPLDPQVNCEFVAACFVEPGLAVAGKDGAGAGSLSMLRLLITAYRYTPAKSAVSTHLENKSGERARDNQLKNDRKAARNMSRGRCRLITMV